MEMSEIYNGSPWAHDIFLVNKAGATEHITGQSSTLFCVYHYCLKPVFNIHSRIWGGFRGWTIVSIGTVKVDTVKRRNI